MEPERPKPVFDTWRRTFIITVGISVIGGADDADYRYPCSTRYR